jgi:hypothetical protein
MPQFVLEIGGKPIMVFSADDQREADELIESGGMAEDLRRLLHNDRPIWSGRKRDLYVREAHPEEVSAWDSSFTQARCDGDANEDDREGWATFLIDVVELTADTDGEP